MGNRAVVHFKNDDEQHGIYLHWNGGPESILAFLAVMEARGWTRPDYASARFAGVVSEFFDEGGNGDGLSLGIVDDPEAWKGGCDNGLYEVSREQGAWLVLQNGKAIAYSDLDGPEKRQHDGIVQCLREVRAVRRAKAAEEMGE